MPEYYPKNKFHLHRTVCMFICFSGFWEMDESQDPPILQYVNPDSFVNPESSDGKTKQRRKYSTGVYKFG